MANFSLTPTPSTSHENTAFVGICADLPGRDNLQLTECRNAASRGEISGVNRGYLALHASSRTSADIWLCCHSNSLCCCTLSTQDAAAFKGQTLELLQSLILSLHEEVTLSCSLFLLIFLSALLPFDLLGYQSPPLFRAFTPCAQMCLFSATALLTFGG